MPRFATGSCTDMFSTDEPVFDVGAKNLLQ